MIHDVHEDDIDAVLVSGVWYMVDAVEELDADTVAFLPDLQQHAIGRERIRVFCPKQEITAVGVHMDRERRKGE